MDGEVISWNLTEPTRGIDGKIIPFLIDWEDSIHPANNLPQKCKLVRLEASHSSPDRIARHLAVIDIQIPIITHPETDLIASIQSPNGLVSLS